MRRDEVDRRVLLVSDRGRTGVRYDWVHVHRIVHKSAVARLPGMRWKDSVGGRISDSEACERNECLVNRSQRSGLDTRKKNELITDQRRDTVRSGFGVENCSGGDKTSYTAQDILHGVHRPFGGHNACRGTPAAWTRQSVGMHRNFRRGEAKATHFLPTGKSG